MFSVPSSLCKISSIAFEIRNIEADVPLFTCIVGFVCWIFFVTREKQRFFLTGGGPHCLLPYVRGCDTGVMVAPRSAVA